MAKNVKILVCGMPRSMTTWIFNVLRELLVQEKLLYLWIEPDSSEEQLFVSSRETVLAKCHHFSPQLAEAADLIFYSYRDLRTAAVSCYRKFGSPYQPELMEGWIEAGKRWSLQAHLRLRYEEVESEPAAAIGSIRKVLAEKASFITLSSVSEEEIQKQIALRFQSKQQTDEIVYDGSTLIWPDHRTFQPKPQDLVGEEKVLYDQVERDFSDWLTEHEYIPMARYGQDVEYRIAYDLIRQHGNSVIIDVGAEKGSFSELALSAGAMKVICFECLPRHIETLQRKFQGEDRIDIYPLAISCTSGLGSLHIATDSEGKELDYHHTLSDILDSSTLFKRNRILEVPTASLSDLVKRGIIPEEIYFLKVDTDGHDMAVLKGLANVRPKIIMTEFWDTLPETSGKNPYTLRDLSQWAISNGYPRTLTVRRNGRLELVEADSIWSQEGDWGNIIFFRDDFDGAVYADLMDRYSGESWNHLIQNYSSLVEKNMAKEVEIQRIGAARRELSKHHELEESELRSQLEAKESEIRRLDHAVGELRRQAEEKEAQILMLHQALTELRSNLDQKDSAFQIELRNREEKIEFLHKAFLELREGSERERQALKEQLKDKETGFSRLQKELEQIKQEYQTRLHLKETVILDQSRALQAYHLLAGLEEKESLLEQIRSDYQQKCDGLKHQLQEKEKVIHELDHALQAYRAAFNIFGPLLKPWQRIRHSLWRLFRPRLGILYQHPARDLVLPAFYYRTKSLHSAPKISLVTPSFRQAGFIERTLKSVLDQKFPNLEYYIQDGGSEDGTKEILARYSERLAGWQSAPDQGQSHAINLGFSKTTGEIMAWLNSDDILLPGSLSYIAEFFQRHPKVDVVYGHRFLIDENDKLIGRWMMPVHNNKALSWADFIPQETLFWRRSIWEKVGGKVDESFHFAIDWDLLLRFRDAGAVFYRLPRFIGGFRVHAQQKTSANISEIGFQEMNRIRERIHGRVPSQKEIRKALVFFMGRHVLSDLLWRLRRTFGISY